MYKKIYLVVLIAVLFSVLFAEENEEKKNKDRSFLIVPNFSYSDETDFVTGLVGVYTKKKDFGKSDAHALIFQYSLKNQIGITLSSNVYYENVKYDFTFAFEKWPSEFYEIGIDSKEISMEKYTPVNFDFIPEIALNITENSYFRILPAIKKFNLDKVENNGLLSQKLISGTDEPFTAGLGFGFMVDRRDDQFYPKRGFEFKTHYIEFSEFIGSEKNYNQFRIEFNKYTTIAKPLIFAFQLMAEFNTGDTPFQEMAELGKNVRGYDSTRFIDKNMNIYRFELRYKPFSGKFTQRLGLVGFTDIGTVFSKIDNVKMDDFKTTFGLGFRFQFSLNNTMHIRADYGRNSETSGMNVAGNEAF